MKGVDISIVVVNWNTNQLLAQCMRSVREHILSDGRLHSEVIVVDNNSGDGSQDMVRNEFPEARLICNEANQGFARANNQAISASSGRYVLLLNSDAQIVPGAVQQMARALDQHETIGIVSVCLAFPNGEPQFCHGRFPTLWTEFRSLFGLHRWDLTHWNNIEEPRNVDWVSGACLMARRETLDEIGTFDESFFFFGEEVDLCRRCRTAGWRVCLVPSMPVIHARAGSGGKSCERFLRLFQGKMRYANKHWGVFSRRLLRAMIVVSSVAKLSCYVLLTPFSPRFSSGRRLWANVVSHLLQRPEELKI